MKIKHLVFDLYGTLIDTDAKVLCTKRAALMRFGLNKWMVTDKEPEEYFSEYARKQGIDEDELRKSFHQMQLTACWFPGIPELLMELHEEGYPLHILSNAGKDAKEFLDQDDLSKLFTTINISYELGVAKPSEEAFRRVLTRIEAEPEECVMIGDNEYYDLVPAKRIGMRAVHYDGRRMNSDELRQAISKVLQQ